MAKAIHTMSSCCMCPELVEMGQVLTPEPTTTVSSSVSLVISLVMFGDGRIPIQITQCEGESSGEKGV